MTFTMYRRALLALALTGTLLIAPAASADAAVKRPAKVTKIRAKTTTTTLRIAWKRPARATSYRVCVKTAPKAGSCVRKVRTRRTSVTFRRLAPNSGHDLFYRVVAHRGKKRSAPVTWRHVNLRVAKGSANRVGGGRGHQLSYAWSRSTGALSHQVQVSTHRDFRADVRTTSRRGLGAEVTGLNGGMTYFARVRGVNGTVKGAWGPVSRTKLPAVPVRATVATYNLCGEDKCRPGNASWFLANVPAWAVRKPLAGVVVRSATPDIVVTQESGKKTGFRSQLPGFTQGAYKSAKTIYFRSSRFSAVDGGWLTLDSARNRYATWNVLRDRSAGTAFLVVNVHLEPHKGATRDALRDQQMARLISKVNARNVHQLPVVWAGDWNSNASNANQSTYPGGHDAPKERFARIGVVNSLERTTDVINAGLNSANGGVLAPKAHGHHVDAVYVPHTGITVESWSMPANFIDTQDGRQYATPFPSDHNPVVAKLVLATP
jgi:hypothetical protein